MSLYRRGRIWWVELSSQRGRVRRSAGTADRKQAQEYHDRLKDQLWRQDKLGEAPPVTWGEAVKLWLEEKPRSLPERYTIRALGVPADSLLPLDGTSLASLGKRFSASTLNRYLTVIRSVHAAAGVKPPEAKKRREPPGRTRWLTAEEWKRLLAALEAESPLLAQAARFAVATGLRENNVLNLEWRNVDLQRHLLVVEAQDAKGRRHMGIPLSPAAEAVLRERRGSHKVFVFAHPDSGRPLYKASNRAWYSALRKAKLVGLRWHDLRHTWASWAVMSGVRLEALREMGGWKTLAMVQRYAHLSQEHLREEAAKIAPVSRN